LRLPLRALPVVLIKEMRLHLMGWHQFGQDAPPFLVAVAVAEYLLDTSKSIPDQLSGVLGIYGERDGHTIGVLRLTCKTVHHQKASQYTSG
jgi:hypothetical protein